MEALGQVRFGTDGIRGIAGEFPLDPLTVLTIGRAIGLWLHQQTRGRQSPPKVLVGRDTRKSGHMLLHMLAGGLLAESVNVYDLGVMTTPGVAFCTRRQQADLGIVISASHNPYEQNGIKLFGADGFKLDDAKEEAIEALIAAADPQPPTSELGRFEVDHPLNAVQYVEHLTAGQDARLDNLRIVLDCANGAASYLAVEAFRAAGGKHLILMNADPDGANINVRAGSEHVRRDRAALLQAIRANQADLGIAFDGDADRVVFVTPGGMLIDGDHTLGILALELQKADKLRGSTVVATDMSNRGLEDFLAARGIILNRSKVGDRYVMERLREGGFTLGGEQAGHVIILDDDHTAGDGIYVALLMAFIAARNKADHAPSLHELASSIPRYPQVIASAHLNGRTDLAQVEGLAELQRETLALFEGKGRVNLRFSGTEPNLLRAMVEGGPGTSMAQVVDRALALCHRVAQATNTPQPRIDLVDCATGEPIEQQD